MPTTGLLQGGQEKLPYVVLRHSNEGSREPSGARCVLVGCHGGHPVVSLEPPGLMSHGYKLWWGGGGFGEPRELTLGLTGPPALLFAIGWGLSGATLLKKHKDLPEGAGTRIPAPFLPFKTPESLPLSYHSEPLVLGCRWRLRGLASRR